MKNKLDPSRTHVRVSEWRCGTITVADSGRSGPNTTPSAGLDFGSAWVETSTKSHLTDSRDMLFKLTDSRPSFLALRT